MKAIVIYDGAYGNTKKIAEAIFETLKECGCEADLVFVREIEELAAKAYDLLILGSPTRWGTMSWSIRNLINKKIKSEEWKAKLFAVFDTELEIVLRRNGPSAAEKIRSRLERKGLKSIMSPLKVAVKGMKGPLKENEIERTREYIRDLVKKCETI